MLGDLLLDLLEIPSVTGSEAQIARYVAQRCEATGARVRLVGDSVVGGEPDGTRPDVLLVAHLDTVPPTADDRTPRREGDRIVGRGASDMKAGLAVALDLFADPAVRDGPCNVMVVAYAREEGPAEANELRAVLDAVEGLDRADLAIVLEPTDLEVQLGCMGGLHAQVVFRGRAAHSARPWQGRNALAAAGPFLTELGARRPEDVEVDGLVFREVVVPTQAETLNAPNVVPDRFGINVNYRFAPDKTLEQAEARLVALVAGRADVVVTDAVPPGRPRRDAPLVAAFISTVAADAAVTAKQAWTDVARFSEVGVPAFNYGPGLTSQAHQAGEYVPEANLAHARTVIARFLAAV
jgi:succinyl-diaminopimelate desuccinylase